MSQVGSEVGGKAAGSLDVNQTQYPYFTSPGGVTPQQTALADYDYGQNLTQGQAQFEGSDEGGGPSLSTMASQVASGANTGKALDLAKMSDVDQNAALLGLWQRGKHRPAKQRKHAGPKRTGFVEFVSQPGPDASAGIAAGLKRRGRGQADEQTSAAIAAKTAFRPRHQPPARQFRVRPEPVRSRRDHRRDPRQRADNHQSLRPAWHGRLDARAARPRQPSEHRAGDNRAGTDAGRNQPGVQPGAANRADQHSDQRRWSADAANQQAGQGNGRRRGKRQAQPGAFGR